MAAYCIGALTDEKVSLASTFKLSFIFDKESGIIKKPNLHPPAPHHLLNPELIIVLSAQILEMD
jgi:hypothetical protein